MRSAQILILFFVLISCKGHDDAAKVYQKGYKDWYLESFRCGVFIPPDYDPSKKYPLVLYLHGHSDTTSWKFGFYSEPLVSSDPCIVLTPKCPTTERAGWGDSFSSGTSPMMKKAFEVIDLIKKEYNLDYDRFYIYGTSMGAIGTFGVIQKNPDMFAAGYALCGYGNPAIAPTLAKIPFWLFHGSDDRVVPVEGSRNVYNAVLQQGGKQIRYTDIKVWNIMCGILCLKKQSCLNGF